MSRTRHSARLGRLVLGVAVLWASLVFAHGPLDHSVRVTIMGDGLELAVTLGPDLAQQALTQGGIAPEQVRELLTSRGPSGHGVVSSEQFATLAGLRGPEGDLAPTRAIVMTDGLEYLFVVNYPRPGNGSLTFQAKYLDAAEGLPLGSLEVVDDASGRRLAVAPLKSSEKVVELTLPALAAEVTASAAPESPPQPKDPAPTASTNSPASEVETASDADGGLVWWVGGLVVIVAAAVLIWFLRQKPVAPSEFLLP